MRVSPAGLEWVVSMRGVCGQARTLRYVCGFFFFYVFNMTKTFLLYPHLFINRIPGKKVSKQGKPKIFLEGKSDTAININSKRKIKRR